MMNYWLERKQVYVETHCLKTRPKEPIYSDASGARGNPCRRASIGVHASCRRAFPTLNSTSISFAPQTRNHHKSSRKMTINDIDPLADAPPSRYAFESDDEDEEERFEFAQPSPAELRRAKESVDIRFIPDDQAKIGGKMIFANGSVGAAWARGASLGEQVGQVNVNKRAVSATISSGGDVLMKTLDRFGFSTKVDGWNRDRLGGYHTPSGHSHECICGCDT